MMVIVRNKSVGSIFIALGVSLGLLMVNQPTTLAAEADEAIITEFGTTKVANKPIRGVAICSV